VCCYNTWHLLSQWPALLVPPCITSNKHGQVVHTAVTPSLIMTVPTRGQRHCTAGAEGNCRSGTVLTSRHQRTNSAIHLQECSFPLWLCEATEPADGYCTESVRPHTYGDLSSCRALTLPLDRYSFPIPQRVGGWVGLSGWLHNKTVYQRTVIHRSVNWAQSRETSLTRPMPLPVGQTTTPS